MGAFGLCLFNNVSFLSYFLTLTPSVNGFAVQTATFVSKRGCHVGIHFKLVRFELYISIINGPSKRGRRLPKFGQEF